jgi:hypothetical protein
MSRAHHPLNPQGGLTVAEDDIFQGRGAPLTHYDKREADWPPAWILPDQGDEADLFAKFAWLADDVLLRTAVNIWDNGLRMPDAFEGIYAGMLSAHARLAVGYGLKGGIDLEKAADDFREAWLGMARQALELGGDA